MQLVIIILAFAVLNFVQTTSVAAAQKDCAFNKSVRQAGITFNVNSRPAAGCTVQILTISAHQGGRQVAVSKADVDYLARSVQAADLTGDGKPELIVISKAAGTLPNASEILDVYYLEGNALRRAAMPELDDKTGYRGDERFRLDGSRIIRAVPVYSGTDAEKNSTAGIRTIKYEFKDGRITPVPQNETPEALPVKPEETSRYRAISQPAKSPVSDPSPAILKPEILEIKTTEAGIEIMADRPIENYKTMHLDKPERIAIDFPGATSKLAGKKIDISRFGIGKVRVGLNKGFLRLVLDSSQAAFPKYTITSTKNGLIIQFNR